MSWLGTFKRTVVLALGLFLAMSGRSETPAAIGTTDAHARGLTHPAPPANPTSTSTSTQIWPATARIRFAGTSTLHDFGGELPARPFLLILSNGVWSATSSVRSAGMATGNPKRDRRMHDLLEVAAFPEIEGAVKAGRLPEAGGAANANAVLLRIRDQELAWPVQISGWEITPDRLRFHAAWELSLKAYGLQPPSVAGLIRVGDTIRLEADVTATNAVPPPASPVSTNHP